MGSRRLHTGLISLPQTSTSLPRPRPNLKALAEALKELEAKLPVPELDYPVEVPLDERTFGQFTSITFRTRHGDIDVVLRPDAPGGGSFNYSQLRRRAIEREAFGIKIQLAALDDIIASKQAAARDRDLAALPMLHRLRDELQSRKSRED